MSALVVVVGFFLSAAFWPVHVPDNDGALHCDLPCSERQTRERVGGRNPAPVDRGRAPTPTGFTA